MHKCLQGRTKKVVWLLGPIALLGSISPAALAGAVNISTAGTQVWTVPAGVTSINIVAIGGGGGGGWGASGGHGGKVTSTLTVTPGQSLTINVGGGGGGTNQEGGGGGGATSVNPGTTNQIIAGGGGGGGGGAGGNGDGSNGVDGGGAPGTGGHGGSGGVGGAGGINVSRPTCTTPSAGGNGNGGAGGSGGTDNGSKSAGASGTGVGSGTGGAAAHLPGACAPGGGGGGYGGGGGGGGAGNDGGGGGGGSVGPAGSVISVGTNRGALGVNGSDGSVSITYADPPPRSLSQAIDATVKGTITAQVSAAVRFSDAQVRNVMEHVQQLGNGFSLGGNRFALGINSPAQGSAIQLTKLLFAAAESKNTSAGLVTMKDAESPKYTGLADATSQNAKGVGYDDRAHNRTDASDDPDKHYGFWGAGEFAIGHMSLSSGTNKFHTDGVTFGFDYLLSQKAIIGAAVGYGQDTTDVDSLGTRVKGRQTSLIAYGVFKPYQRVQLDGMVGFGRLSMDNNRYSALSSALLSSDRKGNSKFGAIGLNLPISIDDYNIKPYIWASYVDIALNAYSESGDANGLAFDRATVKSASLFAGVTASYDIHTKDGAKWVPNAKLEVRRNSRGSVDQSISFADTPGTTAVLNLASTPQDVQTVGLGLRYLQRQGVSFGLSWLGSIGSNSYHASAIRAELIVPF